MESLEDLLFGSPQEQKNLILGGLMFIAGLGVLPTTTDIILLATGALIYKGVLDLAPATFICFCSIALSELLMYELGFRFGQKLLQMRPLRKLIGPKRLEEMSGKLQESNYASVLFIRFMPILRPWILLSMSSLGLERKKFYSMGLPLLALYVPIVLAGSQALSGLAGPWTIGALVLLLIAFQFRQSRKSR